MREDHKKYMQYLEEYFTERDIDLFMVPVSKMMFEAYHHTEWNSVKKGILMYHSGHMQEVRQREISQLQDHVIDAEQVAFYRRTLDNVSRYLNRHRQITDYQKKLGVERILYLGKRSIQLGTGLDHTDYYKAYEARTQSR